MNFLGLNWDKFEALFQSCSRPYSIVVSATSLAASLVIAVCLKADSLTITALSVSVGGVAGGTALLRSMDKKTDAVAATEDKKTAAAGA
jgi:hypothetical protein